jgi:hypothetical protein
MKIVSKNVTSLFQFTLHHFNTNFDKIRRFHSLLNKYWNGRNCESNGWGDLRPI